VNKFSFLLLVLPITLLAQENTIIKSVKEAQDYSIQNNAAVLNSKLDVTSAKKKIWETTTIGLPNITGEITYQNFIDIPTQVAPANAFDPTAPAGILAPLKFGANQSLSGGFTVKQLLFDGTYIVGLQAAKVFLEFSRKNAERTAIETKYTVSRAYYTYLVVSANASVLEQNVINFKKIHQEVAAMYEAGFSDELDKDRATLSLNMLEDQLSQTKRQEKIAKQLLKFQMGYNLKDTLIISDNIENYVGDMTLANVEGLITNYNKSLDHNILLAQLSLNKLDLRRRQMEYLPSLGFFFSHSQNAFNNDFNFFTPSQPWYPTTVWGLNLRMNIFNSFGQAAVVRQARNEYEKVRNQQTQLEQNIEFNLIKAKADYMSALESSENQKENMLLAKRIHEKASIKFKEGVGSTFELNEAESQYLELQAAYYNAVLLLLMAKTDLDKATGTYEF